MTEADPIAALLALVASDAAEEMYDEAVSQRDHALQCADLAIADGVPDALVAAALFHDVGHLLIGEQRGPAGDDDRDHDHDHHEAAGARHLGPIFGPDVARPVALHVAAKRYLCAVDPAYHDALSPASVASLRRQGGPMSTAEAARFRRLPGWDSAVRLRRWDDQAKVPGAPVSAVTDHAALLARVATDAHLA